MTKLAALVEQFKMILAYEDAMHKVAHEQSWIRPTEFGQSFFENPENEILTKFYPCSSCGRKYCLPKDLRKDGEYRCDPCQFLKSLKQHQERNTEMESPITKDEPLLSEELPFPERKVWKEKAVEQPKRKPGRPAKPKDEVEKKKHLSGRTIREPYKDIGDGIAFEAIEPAIFSDEELELVPPPMPRPKMPESKMEPFTPRKAPPTYLKRKFRDIK